MPRARGPGAGRPVPGAGRRRRARWTAAPTAPRCARRLLALPGIGPWTADYVAMRALGDPDVFLPTDIGVRRALADRGDDPARRRGAAERWRPWRSYGLMHLWSTLDLADPHRP